MTYFARTKTNRLKKPKFKTIEIDQTSDRLNWCGQPHAQIGDYVCQQGPAISAGTVGKIVAIDTGWLQRYGIQGNIMGRHYSLNTPATVELLDGKLDDIWLWYLTVIDASAVQEVKDFYINNGRPERIKVLW